MYDPPPMDEGEASHKLIKVELHIIVLHYLVLLIVVLDYTMEGV